MIRCFYYYAMIVQHLLFHSLQVSYIVSLIHHSVVVPLALYYFHQDYMRGAEGLRTVNYAAEYGWFVPWIFGYFIGDTMMFAVPQALHGKYEYLFHHILGLGLMVSAIYIESPTILKFCPHMLICELSTYFFSVAYLLRLSGHRGSRMVSVFEISFAIFFFLTRIVNLPLIMWGVKDVMMSEYMVCWIILVLVLALQFFWLYKIIMSLLKKKSNPETKKVE